MEPAYERMQPAYAAYCDRMIGGVRLYAACILRSKLVKATNITPAFDKNARMSYNLLTSIAVALCCDAIP